MPPLEGGGPAAVVCAGVWAGKSRRNEAIVNAIGEAKTRIRISFNLGFTSIRVQASGWSREKKTE
jgi:hypothetical protein